MALVLDQQRSEDQLMSRKRAVRAREERRKRLTFNAFGDGSLFGVSCGSNSPAEIQEPIGARALVLSAWDDGLVGCQSDLPPGGFCLDRAGCGYVQVACQMLLRFPYFTGWLATHEASCVRGGDCVACVLYRSRLQLCTAVLPALFLRRAIVGDRFVGSRVADDG